jgi:hypothetical protein
MNNTPFHRRNNQPPARQIRPPAGRRPRHARRAHRSATRVPPGSGGGGRPSRRRRQDPGPDCRRSPRAALRLADHHHAGEDAPLWPPLPTRVPAQAVAFLDDAEAQHAGIDHVLQRMTSGRRCWVERVDDDSRDALVKALQTLHGLLAEHLDNEERTLLPLAAAISQEPSGWRSVRPAPPPSPRARCRWSLGCSPTRVTRKFSPECSKPHPRCPG